MDAVYLHDDHYVDYTPVTPVNSGDVIVIGDLVCVAVRPIPANTMGSLAAEGVFNFTKSTAAGSAIVSGTKVYWDAVNRVATATAGTSKYLGKVCQDAQDGDSTVRVRLQQ